MRFLALVALSLSLSFPVPTVLAQQHAHGLTRQGDASPYAGLETRGIKSLSEEDLAALREGRGWGLALPAELNGVPGPAHLLELKDELGLSEEQVIAIEAIQAEMQAEAKEAGERFIAAEMALDAAFAEGGSDEEHLKHLIQEAETARADLRFVHLSRHLSTPPLLTEEQVRHYGERRGYSSVSCQTAEEHCR